MASLNREERNMIIIQGLDFFVASLSGIFVTVFLFVNSSLGTTLFYNFISFVSLTVFYFFSGWTLRKIPSGHLIKISLGASALYFLFLFFLQEKAIHFIVPLAILDGFCGANFWAGLNLNQYVFTNKLSRVRYFATVGAVINIFRTLAPFLGGAIITVFGRKLLGDINAGYATLFLIVGLIFAAMFAFAGQLPEHETIAFSFKHFFHRRSALWKNILWQQLFLGFYDVLLDTVTGILIFLIVENELALGATQTILGILGAIGSIVAIRLLEKKERAYWLGAIGQSLGLLFFAFNQNLLGLSVFIASHLVIPLFNTWLSTVYFQALDGDARHWRDKYHFLVERELVLNGARAVSYLVLFILVINGEQVQLAQESLFILPVFPLILAILLYKFGKSLAGPTSLMLYQNRGEKI